MFVPVIPPPPSRRATELGEKIAELILIFKDKDPGLGMIDIRQALRLAEQKVGKQLGGSRAQLMLMLLMGLMVALGLGVFLYFRAAGGGGGGAPVSWIMIAIVAVMIIVGAVVALAMKK